MEVRLTDNSKLSLMRLADDRLRLDLYQPKTLRDGHGYTLCGTATLAGAELIAFLAASGKEESTQKVRPCADIPQDMERRK